MTQGNASKGTPAAALPLAGLRAIELGHIVAGPTAGQILADLGADVIKVESPDGGDQVRTMPGPITAMFGFLNRNKRSMTLDLRNKEGKAVFLDLARTVDIIVDNFAFGAMDRLGLGYETVSGVNRGVVWLSIKGFLPGGPSESLPMLDELAQMGGGLAFMTGLAGQPMRAGASIIDNAAGVYGIVGVLAALRQREANGGQGQLITAGLFETTTYFVGQWMATAQYSGDPSRPLPVSKQDSRMGFPVYKLFDTKDGSKIFIGVISPAHWDRFCTAFERDDWRRDPRFIDAPAQRANRPELYEAIQQMISGYTRAEAAARLEAAQVPSSPVHRPDELPAHAHLNASGQLVDTKLPDGRTAKAPKLPFRSTAFDMVPRSEAPKLGEHTRDVLKEMGYTDERIEALYRSEVVARK